MKAMHSSRSSVFNSLTTIVLLFLFGFASSSFAPPLPAPPAILVVNAYNDTVRGFSLAGADLGNFAATGMNGAVGIAIDGGGNVYVSNYNDNTIHKFSPTGTDLGTFASAGVNRPHSMAFDSAGNLYVGNSGIGFNKVRKFGPTGTDLGDFTPDLGDASYGLAFDSSGNLYIAFAASGSIRKFGPGGADLGTFASGLSAPLGLAFDSSGKLYVCEANSNAIHKFGPTGTDLGIFANTGLDTPYGLAFDASGNLYVVNYGNFTLHKFGPTGTDFGNIATTGLDGPTFIAIPRVADLSVVKLASPNPVGVGSNITYKITMANAGPKVASNVMLVDPLPAWTSLFSYGAIFGGTLSNVANNVTIRIRSLAVNEVKTITVVARVNAAMVGGDVLTNTVTITSDVLDLNPGDNVASSEVTVRGAPHITTGSSKTFSMRRNNSFILRATGVPAPAWSLPGGPGLQLAVGGPLPSGVTFVNNGDGTAALSGTPAPGTGGNYNLLFTVANGVKPDARQTFILTVNDPR